MTNEELSPPEGSHRDCLVGEGAGGKRGTEGLVRETSWASVGAFFWL